MQFQELITEAKDIRKAYEKYELQHLGKEWSREQLAQGFVGDVGDLMKLLMAKEGLRNIENAEQKLRHEFADCLWSILILADKYDIDLEQSFLENMKELKKHIERSS